MSSSEPVSIAPRRGGIIVRWVLGLLALALLVYAGAMATMWRRQEALIFKPEVVALQHDERLPADVQETFLEVPGAGLAVWHLRVPRPRGVVFFLHGNAGYLGSGFLPFEFYRQLGVDLVAMDYRGFGKSAGHIQSEDQLH